MNREYHKGYSSELHRDIELLVFGHAGSPLLVFPLGDGGCPLVQQCLLLRGRKKPVEISPFLVCHAAII